MTRYSIGSKTKTYFKGYRFLSFAGSLSSKWRKKLLDVGLGALETAYEKVGHKAAEVIGDILGNKAADKVAKQSLNWCKFNTFWGTFIAPEKKWRSVKWFETSNKKMEQCKISKLLNISTVLEFVTKKK